MESIIVALITGGLSLVGVFISNIKSNDSAENPFPGAGSGLHRQGRAS